MNSKRLLKLLISITLFIPLLGLCTPKIVASIQPLQALAMGVTQNISQPISLLPPSASPHMFSLSPSQIKSLNEADIILWVGPELENFLTKPIDIIKSQNKVIITLLDQASIAKLPLREGNNWVNHESDEEHQANKNKSIDPHIWLSIDNAMNITNILTNELMLIDVENAKTYDANRKTQIEQLTQLKQQLSDTLKPVQTIPYLVFHDGFQYFENEFHLNAIGSITAHPEHPLSAKRLTFIQALIKTKKPVCIFTEPQFEPKIVQTLADDTSVKIGTLDPFGVKLNEPSYEAMLTLNANHLVECLQQNASSEKNSNKD